MEGRKVALAIGAVAVIGGLVYSATRVKAIPAIPPGTTIVPQEIFTSQGVIPEGSIVPGTVEDTVVLIEMGTVAIYTPDLLYSGALYPGQPLIDLSTGYYTNAQGEPLGFIDPVTGAQTGYSPFPF